MNMQTRSAYPYQRERDDALRFFRDHQMTVEQDDGVFRCLYFGQPGSSAYHFRLTTWPGHLCISGDIGSYVFARVRDMFQFFSTAEDRSAMPITINASYWSEKLKNGGGAGKHQVEKQIVDVKETQRNLVRAFREIDTFDFASGNGRVEAFRDLRRDLLENLSDDQSVESIVDAIDRYHLPAYTSRHQKSRPICDGWAWDMVATRRQYDYPFLICLYAIVWGIKRYAQHKEGRSQGSHDATALARATPSQRGRI